MTIDKSQSTQNGTEIVSSVSWSRRKRPQLLHSDFTQSSDDIERALYLMTQQNVAQEYSRGALLHLSLHKTHPLLRWSGHLWCAIEGGLIPRKEAMPFWDYMVGRVLPAWGAATSEPFTLRVADMIFTVTVPQLLHAVAYFQYGKEGVDELYAILDNHCPCWRQIQQDLWLSHSEIPTFYRLMDLYTNFDSNLVKHKLSDQTNVILELLESELRPLQTLSMARAMEIIDVSLYAPERPPDNLVTKVLNSGIQLNGPIPSQTMVVGALRNEKSITVNEHIMNWFNKDDDPNYSFWIHALLRQHLVKNPRVSAHSEMPHL